MLLASAAAPAWAANDGSSGEGSAAQSGPGQTSPQDIIVTGEALFPDTRAERNLDPTAIESYGVSTVDELLAELQAEFGDDEIPLILINGQRLTDADDIGAFPIEVLRNLQVLPRGTAVKLGGTSGQRVVSLTLNRDVRTVTTTVAPKYATDGGWHSLRGEGIFTKVHGSTRANVALRMRDESRLLESERGIIQPNPFKPFALGGNVIGFPNPTGEIDPLLSALAGEIVTVAPIPSVSAPTLAGFAAGANDPAITDIGRFRTLRPSSTNYDLNGTFSTQIAPWLSGTATLRLNRNISHSLRGLPSAVFVLAETNPASPFSRDVGLAFYGADPLRSRSKSDGGEGNVTLNATFGQWICTFNAKHSDSRSVSTSMRALGDSIPLPDSVNPFATPVDDLIVIRRDRFMSRNIVDASQLTLTGPVVQLPAGPLTATVEGRLGWNRLHTTSTTDLINPTRKFRRSEQGVRGALDIPLTSRASGFGAAAGDISANAEYSLVNFSDAGTLDHYALGLTWEPVPAVRLRGAIERTEIPAIVQLLGDPVILTPDVRTFDPLTGETVDVTQIIGGNPALKPQTTKLWRVGGLLRLVPRLNLQLDAEYTDTDVRNFVSSLPDSSAAIMLAFPERFVRDAGGNLTTVDLRPVNFDSDHEKRLRWGLSMNAKLGGGQQLPAARGTPRRRTPTTYLQLSANHTVVFSDTIVIRPGLDRVDLLGGGAIGIGGGRLRHQVDGTAAITKGGLGARIGVTWRGPSTLKSQISGVTDTLRFSPVFLFNLRAFADMKQVFPRSKMARGLRLSVDVINLTNDRQRVRDSFGNTPLQYQRAYRDPIGRTIEFEIRKVF